MALLRGRLPGAVCVPLAVGFARGGMAWSGVVVFWVCCPVYWWVVVCCGSSGLPAKQEIAWDGLGSVWKGDTVMGSVELIDRPVSVDG